MNTNIDRYLVPMFQPVVVANNQLIYSLEALFRFKDQARLSPRTIRNWETSGYIKHIDLAMTRCICSALKTQETRFRISINVSVRTIFDAGSEYIEAAAKLLPYTPRLIIEITETFEIPDQRVMTIKAFTDECRAKGIRIALDDCSPDHIFWQDGFIREISPDYLKVDGDFLDACFRHDTKAPIAHLGKMAKEIDAKLIGEKIDSPEKFIFAKDAGIVLLQGHHFGTPEPLKFTPDFEMED